MSNQCVLEDLSKGSGVYIGSGDMPEGYNIQIDPTGTADDFKKDIVDIVYPVNSIYISYSHTSPTALFGGTWERIENAFLWGASENSVIGTLGGEAEHTLTIEEMPMHDHVSWGGGINWVDTNASGTNVSGYKQPSMTAATASLIMTASTGESQPHNNMPPYVEVSIWRRIA